MNTLNGLKEFLAEDPWTYELPSDTWEVVKVGDWKDCHKAESREDIVKHLPTGKFFEVQLYRTGDHWQGYETELSDVVEVEPYEELVTLYRPVKLLAATVPAMSKAKAVSDE